MNMEQIYSIEGMTCNGCVASVAEKLSSVNGVEEVSINLDKKEATIKMAKPISLISLKAVLPEKYVIEKKENNDALKNDDESFMLDDKTKLEQLKPLLLIFLYLFSAVFLMNYKDWSGSEAMLDFMGLFYIIFSFFKFLDLKGFPESFRMYDPLAKVLPIYSKIYPFIELILGLFFLMRIFIIPSLVATLIILGITTVGVSKTLLNKKSIKCACLGTALKLPMTEATFIENTIMLVMALTMLISVIYK
jgi:copper chaperone CopZ